MGEALRAREGNSILEFSVNNTEIITLEIEEGRTPFQKYFVLFDYWNVEKKQEKKWKKKKKEKEAAEEALNQLTCNI